MLKNLLDWIITDVFVIKPKANLSMTNVENGRIDIKDGCLYSYCESKGKWVTVNRSTLSFGRHGTTANQYLNFAGGSISSKSGYRMPKNAVLCVVSVQTHTTGNFKIHIRKNDSEDNEFTLDIPGGKGGADTTVNVNFNTGDYLQCYLEFISGTGLGVDDPVVTLEIGWRQ